MQEMSYAKLIKTGGEPPPKTSASLETVGPWPINYKIHHF